MKVAIRVILALASVAALSAPTAGFAAEYSVKSNTWTCQGPYPLKELAVYNAREDWPAELRQDAKQNGCLPVDRLVDGEKIISFLGEYTYLCFKLPPVQVGAIEGLRLFSCWYVLTIDLRDGAGNTVQPHFSKASPSPHFFDAD